ncbi:MAG: group III truncated hemoglobin [Pyrinomonadaceae bacterium]
MNKDIEGREDIDKLMLAFYKRAIADDLIGFIFTDVAKLDLEHHLPIIGDFWETLLFRSGDYSRHGRNPLQVHGALSQKTPLLPAHFKRWLEIFTETVDQHFAGETTEFIKLRAGAIATRMLEFVSGLPYAPVIAQRDTAAIG